MEPRSARRRQPSAFVLGLGSALPLFVWWLGWFPGFLSSDSIDQYRQAITFDFFNYHPITHTATMWVATRVWESPGAVTLLQVLLMAAVLALVADRLHRLGVPLWLSVGTVWVVALLPMVGVTTIAVWKDVPFTVALVWAFAELLLAAADRAAFWSSPAGPIRLGIALGLVWALRSNGFITAVVMLLVLVVVERRRLARMGVTAAAAVGVGIVLPAILTLLLPVHPGGIEPAEVFLPDMAATVVHAPETLDAEDLELITALASPTVWRQQYTCTDSTPLLFDPRFDTAPIAAEPWTYRALVLETVIEAFPTVAGHRWCAADYLLLPVARSGSFLHFPPYDIPENDLGVTRRPVSDRLFDLTLALYQWAEQPSHKWVTWRPALAILLGIATWAGIALRRSLRPLWLAGTLFVVHLGNVAATTPAQEFRFAFALYLMALLSLPLWWLVVVPQASLLANVPTVEEAALQEG